MVTQPSHLTSKAQLNSNPHATTDFHSLNQSDLTILTSTNQLLPHHFVVFMRLFPPFTAMLSNHATTNEKGIFLRTLPNAGVSPGRASCLSRRRVSHVVGARRTRRVHVVPDVPLTSIRERERESSFHKHIFGCILPLLILMSSRHHMSNNFNTYFNTISTNKIIHSNTSSPIF